MKVAKLLIDTPTQEFYKAIFGNLPKHDIDSNDISDLLTILETLTDRENHIIRKYYGFGCDRQSFGEIGKERGVTRSRIHNAYLQAIKKLQRHPRAQQMELLFMSRAELRAELRVKTSEYHERLETLYKRHRDSLTALITKVDLDSPGNIPIEDMNLSRLSYISLKCKGINTLYELTHLSAEDAMKIRNIGRRCLQEITTKMGGFGVRFRD